MSALAEETQPLAEELVNNKPNFEDSVASLKKVWADPAVKNLYQKHIYDLNIANLDYIYDNIDRIAAADYVPSNEDILFCRQRTIGASTSTICSKKGKYVDFIDVGGQRPERAKWTIVMQERTITAILYFIPSDDYDVIDQETEGLPNVSTKMETAYLIFMELMNVVDLPVVVFFNKVDLLTEKLKKKEGVESYQKIYPKVATGDLTATVALDEIERQLKKKVQNPDKLVNISCHRTVAIDGEQMKKVWTDVYDFVVRQKMDAASL